MMTVRQLREALSDFDQDAIVCFIDYDWGHIGVETLASESEVEVFAGEGEYGYLEYPSVVVMKG